MTAIPTPASLLAGLGGPGVLQGLGGTGGLPPIGFDSNPVATSGGQLSTGLDLIQPVITLDFGGGGGGGGGGSETATNVINALSAQTKRLTEKGTFFGDLGIGPDTLLTVAVAIGLTFVVIAFGK